MSDLIGCNSYYCSRFCDTAELDLRETPLHIAIRGQKLSVINALIQMNVSSDAVDAKGNSVYHLAAATNQQIIEVRYYLKYLFARTIVFISMT